MQASVPFNSIDTKTRQHQAGLGARTSCDTLVYLTEGPAVSAVQGRGSSEAA